jgi:hypothetical protein
MCNVCGQTFGGASNLYHHKKKHHPDEEEGKPCDGFDPEYQNAFSSSNSADGLKVRPSKVKPKLQPSDPAAIPDLSQFASRIKQDIQFNNHHLKQDYPNKQDLSKTKQDDFPNNNQDYALKQDYTNIKQDYPSKQDYPNNKLEDFPRIKQDYSNNKQEDYSGIKHDFSHNKHEFPGIKQDYISKQEYPHIKPSHSHKQDYPRIKQDYPGSDLYSGYKEKLEKLSRKELELADTSVLRDIKPPLSSHSDLSHNLPDFSHSTANHYNQDQSHLQHHSQPSYHRAQSSQLHQQHRMPSSHQLTGTTAHSSHQLPISQSAEEEMCRFRQANLAEEHYRRFIAANMERAGIWAPQHQLKSQHSN